MTAKQQALEALETDHLGGRPRALPLERGVGPRTPGAITTRLIAEGVR